MKTAWCVILGLAAAAWGDDAYYRVPVSELRIVEGSLPKEDQGAVRNWRLSGAMEAYAVVDGAAEAYLTAGEEQESWRRGAGAWSSATAILVVRAPAGLPVNGVLVAPNPDWGGMTPVRFTIAPDAAKPESREGFFAAKESHYDRLQGRGIPGAAWFRRQSTEAHRAQGKPEGDAARPMTRPPPEMDQTYELFAGGQALSENLQLMRDLPPTRREAEPEEQRVPLSSIEGITVRAMDWPKPEGTPALDPLASVIPADQHAVFFASFDALLALADETAGQGLPVFRSAMQTSGDAGLVERYERQLCLRPTLLSRLLGPKVVKSVAVTGSDPYFPTGTDIAVLFEAMDSAALRGVLLAQVRASAAVAGGSVTQETGDADGVAYEGVRTADRSVCAYVAVVGDAVAVTNSVAQLRRLGAVQAGKAPAIATLPEYAFFRSRYPRGAEGQTGFVFLSDATIRRWCGPQWRIGASRRVRAAAIMADIASAHMDDLVAGMKEPQPVESDTPMRTIGTLTLSAAGVSSSVYGTPAFLTPIAELGLTEVAPDEAEAYKRWRDGYQRNWSWAFDPIAASFSVAAGKASADMTVMPLIVGTRYREWINAARGASIAPGAGDPHDSIGHLVFAINAESAAIKQASGMARMFAPGVEIDPLGWLGQSVGVYADPDPFWGEMLAAEDPEGFFEQNAPRLPVGIYAQAGSALKLTAFVAAARGFVEQSAPGMMAWENREHAGQAYVRVGLTEKAKAESGGGAFDNLAVYYAATPKALMVSLNEKVLQRAIEREQARAAGKAEQAAPWLGSSLCLRVRRSGLELLGGPGGSAIRDAMQTAAWSNLPILNEWKRRYPDRDPVKLHEERWGVRLVCPGGGEYRWNEKYRTMESSIYGHPGDPKPGPAGLGPLSTITGGDFGLTFEDQGLRARGVVERESAPTPQR